MTPTSELPVVRKSFFWATAEVATSTKEEWLEDRFWGENTYNRENVGLKSIERDREEKREEKDRKG